MTRNVTLIFFNSDVFLTGGMSFKLIKIYFSKLDNIVHLVLKKAVIHCIAKLLSFSKQKTLLKLDDKLKIKLKKEIATATFRCTAFKSQLLITLVTLCKTTENRTKVAFIFC